ncbi:MAG: heterodisulfide reductase-related iron-sulfur binding cluster [Thiohalorhabdus sp.]|uniref:heterodisulfide reductase-related iron-sulfur binding cluster n=1 Tax=Thiohalorhabdus sp. TaxID=3094134 RepID=UPI00397F5414
MAEEGASKAPQRHPLKWGEESFWDKDALHEEMDRVFDICHTCRRCLSLCNAFPTLFDLIDESETMEVDSLTREDHFQVVDRCYLCDMCFMAKCPYVPPHEWEVDFPHLMLRAKAIQYRDGGPSFRDKVLTQTDTLGRVAARPGVAPLVNWANRQRPLRAALEKSLGVHRDRELPRYASRTFTSWKKAYQGPAVEPTAGEETAGKVAVFGTCYVNYQTPEIGRDLVAVLEHNGIPVRFVEGEQCCGMPRLELGDFDSVMAAKEANLPRLEALVDDGWDIIAPVPSCALMFRQEYGNVDPDDERARKVAERVFDPFEYLLKRHREGLLNTDFRQGLGKVAYHRPCHQHVQNIGAQTQRMLELIPDTEVAAFERCSGHDGTWGVKVEWFEKSMEIGKPLFRRVREAEADHYASDCPIAGTQIKQGLETEQPPTHPLTLVRMAYGLEEKA